MFNKLAAFDPSLRRRDTTPEGGKADSKQGRRALEQEPTDTGRTTIRSRSAAMVDTAAASAISAERDLMLERFAGDFVATASGLSSSYQPSKVRADEALDRMHKAFKNRFGTAGTLDPREIEQLAEKLIELSLTSMEAGESRGTSELAMSTLVRWVGKALDHAKLADLLVDARPTNRDYVCAVLQTLTAEEDSHRLAPALLRLHTSQGGEESGRLLSSVLPPSLKARATALTAYVQQLAPGDVSVATIENALRHAPLDPDRKADRRADIAMQLATVCAAVRPVTDVMYLRAALGNDGLKVRMAALQQFAYALGSELTPARLEAVVTALRDAAHDETSGSPEAIAALPKVIAACVSPQAPEATSLLAVQLKAAARAAPPAE